MGYPLPYSWASLLAQMVKNLPAMGIGLHFQGGQESDHVLSSTDPIVSMALTNDRCLDMD